MKTEIAICLQATGQPGLCAFLSPFLLASVTGRFTRACRRSSSEQVKTFKSLFLILQVVGNRKSKWAGLKGLKTSDRLHGGVKWSSLMKELQKGGYCLVLDGATLSDDVSLKYCSSE